VCMYGVQSSNVYDTTVMRWSVCHPLPIK